MSKVVIRETARELSISNRDGFELPRIVKSNPVNPFFTPDEGEIFELREKEKERKEQERERNSNLKIWEKGLRQSDGLTIRKLNELCKVEQEESKANIVEAANRAIKNRVLSKEPMYQFIEKKREMLLFQMMIDHKREEINNYEELTRLHRRGLERAEQMLEDDIEAFKSYIDDNKRQARDEIKKAEDKAKRRNELTGKIKELLEVKADLMGKNTTKLEQLENARKYKEFLENLNPHHQEIKEKKRRRREQRRQQNSEKIDLEIYSGSVSPELAELLEEPSEDQEEMYFKDPETLMKIFINFEESNLFLISQTSEVKQALEEFKKGSELNKRNYDLKKAELTQHKNENIRQEELVKEEIERLKRIKNSTEAHSVLNDLYVKILEICRGVVSDTLTEPLDILKDVEKGIEDVFKKIAEARAENEGRFKEAEKKTQKKVHSKVDNREVKKEEQSRPEEVRRERRVGRPIMAKCILQEEVKFEKVETTIPQEEIELQKYLT